MVDILSGVGVLDKAMALLRRLELGPAGLAELVEVCGLSRATAHRLLAALEVHAMVDRDEAGRFRLGPGLISLGRQAATGRPLVELAVPVLVDLRDRTGESAQLFVREHPWRRCVAAVDSTAELRSVVEVGARLPLDAGSAGRVLTGERGVQGWVESVAERAAGVASVSAPVVGIDGQMLAALGVSGPIDRLSRSPGRRYGPDVVAAAASLSAALGGISLDSSRLRRQAGGPIDGRRT